MVYINVPLFAGQWEDPTSSEVIATRLQAIHDASSHAGSLLLSACFNAFRREISSLSAQELAEVDIDLADYENEEALLRVPADRYLCNPIIAGVSVFTYQVLRYAAYVEESHESGDSLSPFHKMLIENATHNLGILGFSSGILPACIVATSLDITTYIMRAVEACRLFAWIGIRKKMYRGLIVSDGVCTRTFLGVNENTLEKAIYKFNSGGKDCSIFIKDVIGPNCVTIAGPVENLMAFEHAFLGKADASKTSTNTSSDWFAAVRKKVIYDVMHRRICFPNYSDIVIPIRSTCDDMLLSKETTVGSLVEAIVDIFLVHPMNWDIVVAELVQASPHGCPIRLVNIGPGTDLMQSTERAFFPRQVHILDLSDSNQGAQRNCNLVDEPIAIVGMAVHMPGCRDTSDLWRVLEKGISTVSEIPQHRFNISDYSDSSDLETSRQMKAHTGNFIDGVDEFDNTFFNISPREAKSMDPQQRILLQTAYLALENSGYVPDATVTTKADTFGCYIGAATHDYVQNLKNDIDVYYSTGTLNAFLSGRISYVLQFSGPSIVVDTGCSSSMVAIYQGCRALMCGDCTSAIVGGVNVISSPDMFLGLDRGHFLSPSGQCRPFDASADGYSRSEGCGVFIIKKLSDAVAERDNILGVIRGIEVNQSGLAHSITHPHAATQQRLFARVLERSGVEPRRISVIEAHGTGTQAGDVCELESIRKVFAVHRSLRSPLHVTTVKANIGHLEAASGVASLAKMLLMLKHRTIPRVISVKNLNPKVAPLKTDNMLLTDVQVPWTEIHGQSRIALINNFGAAGSNTAMVVEEFQPSKPLPASRTSIPPPNIPYPVGMSAKTETALNELRSKYIAWLEHEVSGQHLADIAYTMTARRQPYDFRLAVHASDKDELMSRLKNAAAVRVSGNAPYLVFSFPGEGSQYRGMGKSLYELSAVFKKHIDECNSFLINSGFQAIIPIITDRDCFGGPCSQFEAWTTALFSLEYSLAKLWISWGLIPTAVIGHSLGEYAALVIANVLPVQGALKLIATRARLTTQKCALEPCGMLLVSGNSKSLHDAVQSSSTFSCLSVAFFGDTADFLVSGPPKHLAALKMHLQAEVSIQELPLWLSFAHHSPLIQSVLDEVVLVAQKISLHAPSIPVMSSMLGKIIRPGDNSIFIPEYFALRQIGAQLFQKGVSALLSTSALSGARVWIEVGPQTTILSTLESNSQLSGDFIFLQSLSKHRNDWNTLSSDLSRLYVAGFDVRWREVFSHASVRCIDLPSYPFARCKYWAPFKENMVNIRSTSDARTRRPSTYDAITGYAMVHAWLQYPSESNRYTAIFMTPISSLSDYIGGHVVCGIPICPASVYLEQAMAGIHILESHMDLDVDGRSHPLLHQIEFINPLVYHEGLMHTVMISVSIFSRDGTGTFTIGSQIDSSEELIHVRGAYSYKSIAETTDSFHDLTTFVLPQAIATCSNSSEIFCRRTIYEVIFPRVVVYSKEYHAIETCIVSDDGMKGVAELGILRNPIGLVYYTHPAFMDTLIHAAGFLANLQGGMDGAFLCSKIESIQIIPWICENTQSCKVFCTSVLAESGNIIFSDVYAIQNTEPRRMVACVKGIRFRRVRLDILKSHFTTMVVTANHTRQTQTIVTSATHECPCTKSLDHDRSKISYLGECSLASSRDNVGAAVIKIVAETCDINISSIDVKTDLIYIGVDSLMSIEILCKLQSTFPAHRLDGWEILHCKSINDIVQKVLHVK